MTTAIECRNAELDLALGQAMQEGFGFVDDFAPELLEPLQAIANKDISETTTDSWQILAEGQRPEAATALQGILLASTQRQDPFSNLNFVHIVHRRGGSLHWHYDVHDDDLSQAKYIKGSFRAGYNLIGDVDVGYDLPSGERRWRQVGPGTLYLMSYWLNPYHGSKPANDKSASIETSKILLFTDIRGQHSL